MDEAKALAQHQQQMLMHQQQQQQQQQQHQKQQQMLMQQQLQHFQQRQHLQQQHPQQAAISRFPSNIDAHLRPLGMNRAIPSLSQSQNPNPNPNPMLHNHPQIQTAPSSSAAANPNSVNPQSHQLHPQQNQQQQQQQQQQKLVGNRALPAPSPPLAGNQAELQLAYQDAWRVCHPDYRRPFSSLEDACERLLPYHVVADYEAEEDDRILDSDTTGQMPSRSQQWDNNIAAKVAEFTATFEKQALAFNIITRKRAIGEFRSEERLMIEQALLQEEKRAMLELRAEIEQREKAGREAHEAKLRMAAFQAEQARAESHAHAVEMAARAPIRPNAQGGSNDEQEHGVINPDEMMNNGWGNSGNVVHREEEPSEDFLNDEEAENGDAGMQDWREVGEFDLNSSR